MRQRTTLFGEVIDETVQVDGLVNRRLPRTGKPSSFCHPDPELLGRVGPGRGQGGIGVIVGGVSIYSGPDGV